MPVIVRELRAGARQPMNYWSRVLGAAVVIIVFAVMLIGHQGSQAALGAKLFTSLHTAIFVAIWVFVPAMTADCIAREKREGTLGLLFLTPLTPAGIVVGKSLVHLLRAMTLWLSALPVMAVPLLLGGVTWLDIYTAFTFEFCAVIMALSAGLLASSLSKVWGRAVLAAEFISLGFAMFFGLLLVLVFTVQIGPHMPWFQWEEVFTFRFLFIGLVFLSTGMLEGVGWSDFFAMMPPGTHILWVWMVGEILLFCLLMFCLVVGFSVRRVKQSWQDQPLSARKLRWLKIFTAPRFLQSLSRRQSRRSLDQNPIAWLHQCSWNARLTKWGWCLGFVVIECILVTDWSGSSSSMMALWEAQTWPILALALGLTFVAAGSFIKEKENGVLELLLVSPLPLRQLIFGRVLGVWRQFLPAALVLGFASVMSVTYLAEESVYAYSMAQSIVVIGPVGVMAFVTLPFIGLYFSLRLKRILVAWLLTWIMGGFFPVAFGLMLGALLSDWVERVKFISSEVLELTLYATTICLSQIAFAVLACFLLRHSLSRRIYPFA